MKKNVLSIMAIGIAGLSLFSFTRNNKEIISFSHYNARVNGAPFGTTGAPSEMNCTLCHSGTAIPNSNVVTINFSGTNNKYVPGSTYTVSITVASASPKNGFETTALEDAGNTNSGTWVITDATNTQPVTGANSRNYVTHTHAGTVQTTWSFDWTAPAAGTGDVTIYTAGMIANGDGSSSGDEVHLNKLTIQEDTSNDILEQSASTELDNSFKVLNNQGEVRLSFEAQKEGMAKISILSMEGKIVTKQKVSVYKGLNTTSPINLNSLPKGIYLVSLTLDGTLVTRKIQL